MRTNVVINDELISEAFQYTTVKTKRALLDIALREFIEHHKRADLRDFKKKITISPDYDYKKLREQE